MITVQNLVKTFDGFTALDGVSCTIPEGSIYGMVGSNGAGKSTFLRLLCGIYKPDSGSIYIDGKPVWENPQAKELFMFVPDDLHFINGADM
jgi:ABC-2 type transport system ATP-binding protein